MKEMRRRLRKYETHSIGDMGWSSGCIVIGALLFAIGWTGGGRPGFYLDKTGVHSYNKNRSDAYHIQEKMELDQFSEIGINVEYADVEMIPSDGYYIEYQLDGNYAEPVLEVKDQKLRFREGSRIFGVEFFNFGNLKRSNERC